MTDACRYGGPFRFHAASDVPAQAAARAALAPGDVKAAVLSAIQENVDDLAGLTLADRVELIAAVLPYLARETIRSYCARNLARR